MTIRWIAAMAAAALLATGCGGDGDGDGMGAEPNHYLSLGDSLTVGVQPDEDGTPGETSDGYTDVLYRDLKDTDSTLRHERMGCGGEDTTSFLHGGIDDCDEQYEGQSQLEAAEEFLADHEGEVGLVTLTIGGNNFTGCVEDLEAVDGPALDTDCVEDGLERIESEIPEIATRLRAAAGEDTQIIAMTYYNPFLAAMLLDDGDGDTDSEGSEGDGAESDGQFAETDGTNEAGEAEGTDGAGGGDGSEYAADDDLVEYATEVLEDMNESLSAAYAASGIDVADIGTVFDSTNFDVPDDSTTGMPSNVQHVCDFTWMCNVDRGPDIHTNQAGAQEIAAAFEELVG